jgi:hypothetical protein
MTRDQIEAQIKAAAWTAAAHLGANAAVELLQRAAREIRDSQWKDTP